MKVESLKDPVGINEYLRKQYGKERYDIVNSPILARYIWRKLSLIFTYMAVFTKLSANQITLIGLLTGTTACVLYSFGESHLDYFGSILLIMYSIFDHVDGEVSRLKNESSPKGYLLDHIAGKLNDFMLIGSISYGSYVQTSSINYLILGFIIYGSWAISSDILTSAKVQLLKLNNHRLAIDEKVFSDNSYVIGILRSIYLLLFSGLTRTAIIIIYMIFPPSLFLYYILLVLGVGNILSSLLILNKHNKYFCRNTTLNKKKSQEGKL